MHKAKSSQKPINNGVKVPKVLIFIGHILQFFSHNLATKFAVKLFKTPIRFKTPEREKIMAKSAQKSIHHINSIQRDVMVYTYGYSKKKVLLVHGWSGRGTQLYKIADKLLENGYMTISFDAPAHGKSSGKATMMPDFIATIHQLEKELGPFEIAIGHSLGGMAVLNAVKQNLKVKKLISIGAGDIITDIIINFIKKLKLKPVIVDKMKLFYLKKFNESIDNYSAHIAAKDVKIPTLIIHDTEDKEVAVSCAQNIRQKLINGELLITNGLGHTRILKDDQVINRVIEFIKRVPKNEII